MKKCHERDSFPRAAKTGRYGCGRCGDLRDIATGEKLICHNCFSSLPMVLMDEKQKVRWGDPPPYIERR